MKLSFDKIESWALSLIARAASAKTVEEKILFWDSFHSYLNHCGWSNQEFDLELLNKIDVSWTPLLN